MREWGINAPSRFGRTQRLNLLSAAGGFSGRHLPLSLRTKPDCTARNVSLGTVTGWLFENQQPASALSFLTTGATVLVTTIDLECTTRTTGFFSTIGSAGLCA